MAKNIYKIPESLDHSLGDVEISLTTDDGVGGKPISIKIVLAYILSALACFFLVTSTFIGDGGFWIVPFVAIWAALTFLLLKRDDTDLPQLMLVPTILDYIPKMMRKLYCRDKDKAINFMRFIGISDYDPESGLIEFIDGKLGYAFMVTGSASVLLFEQDRKAILDRVDIFYRKIKEDVELIFLTTKESQKVFRQLSAEERRFRYLNSITTDEDLLEMCDTRFRCLRDYVGGEFRSIHQYLIIKAESAEALDMTRNILRSECENSSLVFKSCIGLSGGDVPAMLKTIFTGKESV